MGCKDDWPDWREDEFADRTRECVVAELWTAHNHGKVVIVEIYRGLARAHYHYHLHHLDGTLGEVKTIGPMDSAEAMRRFVQDIALSKATDWRRHR